MSKSLLILYHRTTDECAEMILREGFRDATDYYLTTTEHTGVWFSNTPLDVNEGPEGNVLLRVELALEDGDIACFEWVEDGKPYREWLMPAKLINEHGTVRVIDEDRDVELAEQRRRQLGAVSDADKKALAKTWARFGSSYVDIAATLSIDKAKVLEWLLAGATVQEAARLYAQTLEDNPPPED